MRICEGGTAWMRDVLKVKEKFGSTASFEIERHGEAGDPKTKYTTYEQAMAPAEPEEVDPFA